MHVQCIQLLQLGINYKIYKRLFYLFIITKSIILIFFTCTWTWRKIWSIPILSFSISSKIHAIWANLLILTWLMALRSLENVEMYSSYFCTYFFGLRSLQLLPMHFLRVSPIYWLHHSTLQESNADIHQVTNNTHTDTTTSIIHHNSHA